MPERDCSDDDSDRVSIRSIIDVDAPADQVGQGAAEVPDRALSDVAEEAAPEGVAAGPAPVLPAAVAEAALAVLPADTLHADTMHAALPATPKVRFSDRAFCPRTHMPSRSAAETRTMGTLRHRIRLNPNGASLPNAGSSSKQASSSLPFGPS